MVLDARLLDMLSDPSLVLSVEDLEDVRSRRLARAYIPDTRDIPLLHDDLKREYGLRQGVVLIDLRNPQTLLNEHAVWIRRFAAHAIVQYELACRAAVSFPRTTAESYETPLGVVRETAYRVHEYDLGSSREEAARAGDVAVGIIARLERQRLEAFGRLLHAYETPLDAEGIDNGY